MHMLPQKIMIERVRELCTQDDRVVGALIFGSFAVEEGDQFSDIEFALFFRDESFAAIDKQCWVAQIAPLALFFVDDFGHHTAIFENLIRGEFHFEPVSRMSVIKGWQGYGWFPSASAAILVDRTGDLEKYIQPMIGGPPLRDTRDTVTGLNVNFINLMLFGANVMERGEYARAWGLLSIAHNNLLKLVRLTEDVTDHWPTPSKSLERDLSEESYNRYRLCTAGIERGSLWRAYRETWAWGLQLMSELSQRHDIDLPRDVTNSLTGKFSIEVGS